MYLNNVSDVVKLFFATLSLDTTVLFLTRYFDVGGKSLNKWYDNFGLLAVLSDVSVIVIGFLIANAIYPLIFQKFALGLYLAVVVVVQMIHDILFYFFVIHVLLLMCAYHHRSLPDIIFILYFIFTFTFIFILLYFS